MSDKDKGKTNGKVIEAAANEVPVAPAADPVMDDAGLAAEMIGAAAGGATVQTPKDERPENSFMRFFPEIAFKTTDSGKVYDNSDGSRIRKVAGFVAIAHGGAFGLNGNIYARLQRGAKTMTAECSFVGTRNAPALVALDEKAKSELSAFRRYVAQQYTKWRNGQPTTIRVSAVSVPLEGIDAGELFAE